MTGRERIEAVLASRVPDRVPVFPNIHFGTARFGGYTIKEFATDGKKNAASLIGAWRECGYDGVQVGSDVTVEGEAVGSLVNYPEDNIPSVIEPFLSEPRIDRLKMPDPYRDGRMPVLLESTRMAVKEVGEKAFVVSTVMGPLNLAGQIRGVENLMLDFYDRPGFVEELLDFAVEVGSAHGRAQVEAGAHGILIGEALASPSMISPAFFKKFIRDRERRLIQALQASGAKNTILHICGDIRRILEDCALTGTNLIDVDWMVDIGELIENEEISRAKITARGNLNPAGVLLSKNPEDVIRESRKLIEANKGKGRFILSAGCNMSPASVPENLRAMVKATEMFGGFSNPEQEGGKDGSDQGKSWIL
jgi:uroporphyrinogen decarboxylase